MLDFSQFPAAFPTDGPKPYDHNGIREIETFRKRFDGVLFIDRVLQALGIGEGKAYPPKGDSGLRALHQQICESKVSGHAKLSVLYYLLLDYDEVRRGARSQLAEALADESGLPANYQILMRGLWHMDRGEFKYALEHLAHPSLPSEFADDILAVLVRHAPRAAAPAASDHNDTDTDNDTTTATATTAATNTTTTTDFDYSLALAYYHTTQPVLQTPRALELLFGALARTSVAEALRFARRQPEHARRPLFERLVASALQLDDDYGGGDTTRSGPGLGPGAVGPRARELAGLPLTPAEESWLREYLASGEAVTRGRSARAAAAALAQMRDVVTGRHRGPVAVPGELGGQAAAAVRAGR